MRVRVVAASRRIGAALLVLSAFAPHGAGAQPTQFPPEERWLAPMWVGDVTLLSANSLLSGLTAGALQAIRGDSFYDGFARGALGGAVAYGGRRIAAGDFWGAGLLGRQVGAAGSSMVRNASDADPLLSRLSLPIGPVYLEVSPTGDSPLRAEVDAFATTWLVSALLDDRLELDTGASVSAGAPVFHAPRHRLGRVSELSRGVAVGGLIILGYGHEDDPRHDVIGHERVHVLQYDYYQEVLGDPLENWAIAKVPGGRGLLSVVRPRFVMPALQKGVIDLLDLEWADRPWEIEAEYLEHR